MLKKAIIVKRNCFTDEQVSSLKAATGGALQKKVFLEIS